MAPSQAEWNASSEEKRRAILEALPGEVYAGTALLLENAERIAQLERMLDEAQQRAARAEREVARLRGDLERLTKR